MPFSVPICGFLTAMATANALAFSGNRFKLRGLALLALVIFGWNFYNISHEFTHNALCNASITAMIWIYCLKIFDDLCLTQVSFGHWRYPSPPEGCGIPGAIQDHGEGLDGNLRWAIEFMGNLRGIGTKWTINNMQPITHSSGRVPSRLIYLGWSVVNIVTCYFMLDMVGQFIVPLPQTAVQFVSADREHLFSRLANITAEELEFRAIFLRIIWLAIPWAIRIAYFVLAFVHVGLGIQDVTAWPEIFCEWKKTYSLRIFWGVTFHQAMRRPLVSISEFLVHRILRLRKKNILARYFKLLCCFSISAFVGMQTVAAIDGSQFHEHTSVARFFLLQPAGIIIEDIVQKAWGRAFGSEPAQWQSYLGMAWTVAFFFWTSPYLVYPVARTLTEKEAMLVPFPILNGLNASMVNLFANIRAEDWEIRVTIRPETPGRYVI